jgi:hypothetical protein
MRVIDNIPIKWDLEEVRKQLRLKTGSSSEARELVGIADPLIHGKVLYKVSYISKREENTVEVNGVMFTSRVLRINLDTIERVFPFIITIGKALEDRASASNDLLRQFYLETIGDMALRSSRRYVEEHLKRHYGLGQLSRMSPGSLRDWPITEQKPLFSLFGDVKGLIGVTLTESMLMIPRKSISGIFFPTEVKFFSCQLCPREGCPARKAPYDEMLRQKYGLNDE